jgi:hypothetical protein
MSEGACYRDSGGRGMAILSLLKYAHRMFSEASVIRKLDDLERIFKSSVPDIHDLYPVFVELDPAFLDAFRIATCFENMFKAQLLKFGYVVHEIDGGGTCQPVLDSYFKVNVFFTAPAALSVGKLTWSTLVPRSSGLIGLMATHSGGIGTRGCPRTKRSGC